MIRVAQFSELLAEEGLIEEYAGECSIPEIGPINPQPDIYAAMEKSGMMRCFGAFHADRLAGFAVVLTPILPHYGRKVATLESLFISAQHRQTALGLSLMTAVERYAKDAGCTAILYSAPSGGQLECLLERSRHYRRTNAVFCRSV
jgi:GNAT superfamily N-acetyltransferase